jgi:O-antigen ligase
LLASLTLAGLIGVQILNSTLRGQPAVVFAGLWVTGVGTAIVVASSPAFEHGIAPVSTPMHDRLSQLTYVASFGLVGIALLGSIRNPARVKPRAIVAAVILYGLALALSGFINGQFDVRLLVFPGLVFVVTRARPPLERIVWHLRWILRVITIGSLILLYVDEASAAFTANDRTIFGVSQLAGLTQHPNVLGLVGAFAVAAELSPCTKTRSRPATCLALLVPIATLLLAQSRAGWLCAIIVLGTYLMNRKAFRTAAIPIGFITVLLSLVYLLATGKSAANVVLGPNTLNGREGIWSAAVQLFRLHPLMGAGPGAFSAVFRASLSQVVGAHAGQAHNQALQTLATVGLVGGSLLVAFLWTGLRQACLQWMRGAWLPMALILVIIADGLFEAPIRGGQHGSTFVVLALMAVLTAVPRQAHTTDEPSVEPPHRIETPRKHLSSIDV